jgi:hypothetical protein
LDPASQRNSNDGCRRELEHVGLHARHRCAGIDLGAPFKTGLRVNRQPAIDSNAGTE